MNPVLGQAQAFGHAWHTNTRVLQQSCNMKATGVGNLVTRQRLPGFVLCGDGSKAAKKKKESNWECCVSRTHMEFHPRVQKSENKLYDNQEKVWTFLQSMLK